MGFASGYEHDVFVSYAHLDNISSADGEPGWVSHLVQKLDTEVRQRLGTKALKISIDRELSHNRPLTPEIMAAIRRSATLLVIMSPAYLNSEWCARERGAFLDFAGDCVTRGRIFIVHCRETEHGAIPSEFGDLVGFKFWTEDPDTCATRPLGGPDPVEKEYVKRVYELSHRLARTLQELRAGEAQLPPPGRAVFLARSTEDLDEREEDLKGYLAQAGVEVLPQTWYPETGAAAFTAAMEADLKRCKVFVQLLSACRGRRVEPVADRRYPALQDEIARRCGRPVLQWREPGVDPDGVHDSRHRELLDGARVCGFEEFKRAVVEQAHHEPAPPKPRPASAMAFVDAEARDLPIAEAVGDVLAEQGVECFWPIGKGSPEQVRKDLEEQLRQCDGLLLVYGAAEPLWVRNQLLQIRRIASQRERPLAALALCVGPPPDKDELGFKLPKLITLDCRNGLRADTLGPFIGQLRSQVA